MSVAIGGNGGRNVGVNNGSLLFGLDCRSRFEVIQSFAFFPNIAGLNGNRCTFQGCCLCIEIDDGIIPNRCGHCFGRIEEVISAPGNSTTGNVELGACGGNRQCIISIYMNVCRNIGVCFRNNQILRRINPIAIRTACRNSDSSAGNIKRTRRSDTVTVCTDDIDFPSGNFDISRINTVRIINRLNFQFPARHSKAFFGCGIANGFPFTLYVKIAPGNGAIAASSKGV